ncbi:MAG: ATP-binding protein, partial [Hyphomicrobiales bacterium]
RGHASIPLKTHLSEITIYRPFLGLRRGELRQALSQIDVAWVDDPTNEDIRYERPRVRQVLRRLENTSYGTRQIAAYAQIMGRFRKVLSEQISRLVAQACSLSGDDLEIEPNALKNYPGTVGLETLRELVRFVGGDAHMIDRKQAGQVLEKLVSSANTLKPFSAGRCVLSPKKDGTWTLSRANRALPTVQVSGGKSVRWDGRYVVSFSGKADETVTISPHNVLPRVMQDTANCKIIFRPQVMDGPVSCLDKAIFREFSALLDPAVS